MPEYRIKLNTSDAQTISFTCEPDQDLITAAIEANIYLVAQCRSGSCGACVAHCEQGDFELASYSEDVLSELSRQQKHVLLCRTYPRSDMVLNLTYNYNLINFSYPVQRSATIINKTYLTPDTIKLELQLIEDAEGNTTLNFQPGQFVELFIPETEIKRPYSLANAPNWDGLLEFLIKLHSDGRFSTFLRENANIGTVLKLNEAQGRFTLVEHGLRPRYFVAGGCGLASVLSMLRYMAELQEPHETKLFFGVWKEEELFYQQELAALAADYNHFNYQLCVTRPSETWQGYRGSVVDALDNTLQHATTLPDIYICGSTGLIEAVANVAKKYGIERDSLIYEHYSNSCAT